MKNKKLIWVIVIVVALAAISVGGYFYYKNKTDVGCPGSVSTGNATDTDSGACPITRPK